MRQSWRPGPTLWFGGCWYRQRKVSSRHHWRRFLQVHWSRICPVLVPGHLQPLLFLLVFCTPSSLDPPPWSGSHKQNSWIKSVKHFITDKWNRETEGVNFIDIWLLPYGCRSRPRRVGFVQRPRPHQGDAAAWRPLLYRQHPRKQKGSGSRKSKEFRDKIEEAIRRQISKL